MDRVVCEGGREDSSGDTREQMKDVVKKLRQSLVTSRRSVLFSQGKKIPYRVWLGNKLVCEAHSLPPWHLKGCTMAGDSGFIGGATYKI